MRKKVGKLLIFLIVVLLLTIISVWSTTYAFFVTTTIAFRIVSIICSVIATSLWLIAIGVALMVYLLDGGER